MANEPPIKAGCLFGSFFVVLNHIYLRQVGPVTPAPGTPENKKDKKHKKDKHAKEKKDKKDKKEKKSKKEKKNKAEPEGKRKADWPDIDQAKAEQSRQTQGRHCA